MREVSALLLVVYACATAAPVKRGDVVFQTDFESRESRDAWSKAPCAGWVGEGKDGGQCLKVTVAEGSRQGHMIRLPLDLTALRGARLTLECMARAENVTEPSQPYLGVKFMLHYTSATQGSYWHNENDVHGTFGWKRLSFMSPIAGDAEGGELYLGLQDCGGTVWLDEIKVTVAWPPPGPRPARDPNAPPAFRGHNLPRLRGVMSPNEFRDEDLRVLGQEWNANLIRWQMTRAWGQAGTDRDLAEYDQWIGSELEDLAKATEACKRYGIKVVIDLHSPPGGRYTDSRMAMLFEPMYQDHFVKVWKRIATRFRGDPAVWGYDLVNEPVQGDQPPPEGMDDYLGAQVRAAKAIRAIDPDTPIIIAADQWDSAPAYACLEPVDVPNVIYQVHMYWPAGYTHQGVSDQNRNIQYPGEVVGVKVDKEALRRHLQPVRDFQLAFNVHIYVGEFSAARWAPGAAQYLADCIDIFEEYGWDWSYHAYREWDGWSLEHGPDKEDRRPTAEPCDRKQVLLAWFARNERP